LWRHLNWHLAVGSWQQKVRWPRGSDSGHRLTDCGGVPPIAVLRAASGIPFLLADGVKKAGGIRSLYLSGHGHRSSYLCGVVPVVDGQRKDGKAGIFPVLVVVCVLRQRILKIRGQKYDEESILYVPLDRIWDTLIN